MATFLGKALLVAGLGFEAYTLLTHSDTISKFNLNYSRGLSKLPLGSDVTGILYNQETIARYAVVALYALSVFILFLRSKLIKFLVLLGTVWIIPGVIINTLLLANPYLDKSENAHFLLLQNFAIIGGLFYLLGEESVPTPKRPT